MDVIKIDTLLKEEMVFMDVEAEDYESLLRYMSSEAQKQGYVKEGYVEAVLEREAIYPTGLPTEILKVAVPHSMDRDQVIAPVISIATLKKPVNFKEMGEGVRDVPVDVVFLLAVCGSKEQLTILQKIIGLFSNKAAMTALKEADTKQALISAVKEHLYD